MVISKILNFFYDKTYTLIIFKYKNIFFKIFFVEKRKKIMVNLLNPCLNLLKVDGLVILLLN